MRIMFDTNVLISLLFFPSEKFQHMMEKIFSEHTLVLSSFVIEELNAVTERKFPSRKKTVDQFLSHIAYEMVYTPKEMDNTLFQIRDKNDYPVLYSAIVENVDVLVTGDKDFAELTIEKPEILTPVELYERIK